MCNNCQFPNNKLIFDILKLDIASFTDTVID